MIQKASPTGWLGWVYCRRALLPLALAADLAGGVAFGEELNVEAIVLPSREVTLSLPMEATLRKLQLEEGAKVRRGDVLAILYGPVEVLDRDKAAKHLERAEFDLRTSDKLRLGNIVSEESATQKRLDCEQARIEHRHAEAALAEKTLTAPFDGVVLRLHKSEGEAVGRLEKIIELVDYATLHIEGYAEARYLGRIRNRQDVRVAFPDSQSHETSGSVVLVDPVVEPGSGLFRVRVKVANPDLSIPSGIPARILIDLP